MIKLEHTQVMNLEGAIRGARNPMNSWSRSDSAYDGDGSYVLGPNDLDLGQTPVQGEAPTTANSSGRFWCLWLSRPPMYWWKEFDTPIRVGTVANSTSTMHKIHSKPFELDDFSHDHLTPEAEAALLSFLSFLEQRRQELLSATKNRADWCDLIQLLPSSYNQTRTVTMNYENLVDMYFARRNHKLAEWHDYCDWILTPFLYPGAVFAGLRTGRGAPCFQEAGRRLSRLQGRGRGLRSTDSMSRKGLCLEPCEIW